MSVYLTHRALSDIRDIHEYSTAKWGSDVADKYLITMEEAISLLESYPDVLVRKPHISDHFYAYQSGKHWLICDRTNIDVFVLTVKHVSMNLLDVLSELEPMLSKEMEVLHNEVKKYRGDK